MAQGIKETKGLVGSVQKMGKPAEALAKPDFVGMLQKHRPELTKGNIFPTDKLATSAGNAVERAKVSGHTVNDQLHAEHVATRVARRFQPK
jgi:hypothetical protein